MSKKEKKTRMKNKQPRSRTRMMRMKHIKHWHYYKNDYKMSKKDTGNKNEKKNEL